MPRDPITEPDQLTLDAYQLGNPRMHRTLIMIWHELAGARREHGATPTSAQPLTIL